ncbi:chondrolectin-like, partial [Scomber japonicus]|uniref:chondrolectin-like n=1 Tax=Scomber japonicus TaxID=13676 RepID=UPI0023060E7D
CPSGWTPNNGRCFRYIQDHKSWADAEKYCILLGGNLASIHHYKEYHAIQELLKSATNCRHTHAWIGGHDAVQEGTWLWSDGTKFIYRFWCRGEPNNCKGHGQHCIQMNYSDKKCWDDDFCKKKKSFVCVKRHHGVCAGTSSPSSSDVFLKANRRISDKATSSHRLTATDHLLQPSDVTVLEVIIIFNIIVTMKMLVVCALICAMMALATARSPPTLPSDQSQKADLDKRACCPCGWTRIHGRCFRYISRPLRWAQAEKYCQRLGGNLASIHSYWQYRRIQWMIRRACHQLRETWIGGTDAQEERTWLWSDGTPFRYQRWCRGEPNNHKGSQHCLTMNHSACKCWDDMHCWRRKPFVCVRRR